MQLQMLHTRPGCKSCWFRQSRPRLSRPVPKAYTRKSENRCYDTRRHGGKVKADSQKADAELASSAKGPSASLTSPSLTQASQQNEADRLVTYGDSQASTEETQLLAALNEIRQTAQAADSSSKSVQGAQQQNSKQAAAGPGPQAGQPSGSNSQTTAAGSPKPSKALSKADMLAKLAQAKAYKQDTKKIGGAPAIVDTKVVTQQPAKLPQALVQRKDSFSSTQRRPQDSNAAEDTSSAKQSSEGTDGDERTGSAAEPARFLQQAMQRQSEDSKNMSEEAYSLLKETQKRSQKVDIISIDKSYNQGNKVMDPNYNPKVSTWGVFERPANISEAYGGGRTIRAGTPLEDAAVTQARKERMAAALSRYKRDAALEVDPVVLQRCEAAFAEGEELFKNKQIAAALMKYAVAAELTPIKTALGGRARLQQAICLDSLGQNKEAYTVYLMIQTHPLPEVAKQAKRMIFGFKAMDNLKAHTISYSVSKGAYEQYFNRFTGDWDSVYVSKDDDDSSELSKSVIIALAVMLAPLAFVAAKILL